ncbi:MAG: biopolymer transporter ExbD [Pirellulales bacterium]
MFRSVQSREQASQPPIDIAPLIDVVFILLLFFLVSSTFARDSGVEVTRPQAAIAQSLEPASMRISVTATGDVYTDGVRVSIEELRARVSEFVTRQSRHNVIVIPDADVSAGRLVEVMDAARLGGATDVAVATGSKFATGSKGAAK